MNSGEGDLLYRNTTITMSRDADLKLTFLGVNYYNINHIELDPGAEPMREWPGVPNATLATPPGHLTDMGWGVEPSGLIWMLNRVSEWAPGLPLMIMENGAAYPDEIDPDGAYEGVDDAPSGDEVYGDG